MCAHHKSRWNRLFELQDGNAVEFIQSRIFLAIWVHKKSLNGLNHLPRVPRQHLAVAGTGEELRVRLGRQPLHGIHTATVTDATVAVTARLRARPRIPQGHLSREQPTDEQVEVLDIVFNAIRCGRR